MYYEDSKGCAGLILIVNEDAFAGAVLNKVARNFFFHESRVMYLLCFVMTAATSTQSSGSVAPDDSHDGDKSIFNLQ